MSQETETRGRVRIEPGRKRVRAYLNGALVADTVRPYLVWEAPYYPTYYIPAEDVRAELKPTGKTERSPSRGDAEVFDVAVGGRTASGAARRHAESPVEALRDLIRIDFGAMTEWFEEDEPIYVHPRDPFTRVDILGSSRHIRVEIDGVTVADSHQPRILFETGLPPRYYLPLTDIRMDLLTPTETQTQCPYKGTATYWSVDTGTAVHEDVVWGYRTPLPESQKIAGLASFYNEKVDIYVDGVLEERPKSKF
ncbi:MAG TPA: DUF427 domain-containing protein [Actinocrinis sp.]|jgi:uncharacterized protein (DUF427 family)|uniref:DUF427 domain-containing protein n=1 Tax=Actinocrinis sp. TaxID=1920516 RepID=UPI002DDD2060|nr:DUF427 domain-containing protein [Actinocrinis sp.]HEV3170086.1 DUF427 domain-containing protein [Actinocrinis sp.]